MHQIFHLRNAREIFFQYVYDRHFPPQRYHPAPPFCKPSVAPEITYAATTNTNPLTLNSLPEPKLP